MRARARRLLARCPDVPVYAAELDVLTQLTGFHLTRGMLCAMRRPKLRDPAVLLQDASRVAVLENVMNPTNLGAIFRSAAALGMDAVLLTSAGSDPLYRARGAREHGHGFSGAVGLSAGGAGQSFCTRSASARRPWRCGTIPSGWTIRASQPSGSSPS